MKIFGYNDEIHDLYLPKGTLSWSVEGMFPKGGMPSNAALLDFALPDVEAIDVCRCFDSVNHVFSFGRDITKSLLTLSVILFLGEPCSRTGRELDLKTLRKNYGENRVSAKPAGLEIELGGLSLTGFLVGMRIGSVDAKTYSCSVELSFILKEEP